LVSNVQDLILREFKKWIYSQFLIIREILKIGNDIINETEIAIKN